MTRASARQRVAVVRVVPDPGEDATATGNQMGLAAAALGRPGYLSETPAARPGRALIAAARRIQ